MKKTAVSIDRLEIRLKGISPQTARSLVGGLGGELIKQLAAQHSFIREGRAMSLDKIDLGPIQATGDSSPSDLRGIIAGRIVESITSGDKIA